jgi:hypothetical protein
MTCFYNAAELSLNSGSSTNFVRFLLIDNPRHPFFIYRILGVSSFLLITVG